MSTSTHYQTQIFDLVFDVHVSAQRLSCVRIIVRTAKYVRCLRQAPYLRQQAPLTPKAPTRPKTMSLKYDQNHGTNNCTVIASCPILHCWRIACQLRSSCGLCLPGRLSVQWQVLSWRRPCKLPPVACSCFFGGHFALQCGIQKRC